MNQGLMRLNKFRKADPIFGNLMTIVTSCLALALTVPVPTTTDLKQWASEATMVVQRDLWDVRRQLYVESLDDQGPSFCWSLGVWLSALTSASQQDRRYRGQLRDAMDQLQSYWNSDGPVAGYDVRPVPKSVDRYYDDNAWLVPILLEAGPLLRQPKLVQRAEETMVYVASGEDNKLGGGIYWRESDKASKNTCSNAPSAYAALRLAVTKKGEERLRWIAAADRWIDWCRNHLRDPGDGLYWDSMRLDGTIENTKCSYNSALMIRSLVLRAKSERGTQRTKYLDEARKLGIAARKQWVQKDGSVRDDGSFAHLLLEAFYDLDTMFPKDGFGETGQLALKALHKQSRDSAGRYPKVWGIPIKAPLSDVAMLHQASVARAYWVGLERRRN
jgi:predicted alpha-1,6-mannanase (GH76 family)